MAIRFLLAAALVSAGCGATASRTRDARTARYDATFPVVWQVVSEEVARRFHENRVDDPVRGQIVTNWIIAQNVGEEDTTTVGSGQTAVGSRGQVGQTALGNAPRILFRVMVDVKGPKPWRVNVDGEAARYEPGMAVLQPFRHGSSDEPAWVQNRIDNLAVAIHDRLKNHVAKVEVKEVAQKTHDTTPWANLPDRAAVSLIGQVHEAALARNAGAIRPTMSDDFRWGLGADGSADTAVALWSADPTKLKELAHALEDGCAAESGTGDVVCPAVAKTGATARFRKVAGNWRFIMFVAR